jgi:hypothetical protein
MHRTGNGVAAAILVALGGIASGCRSDPTPGGTLAESDAAAAIVSVEVSAIAGPVRACPAGQAHPLVCCVGSPGVLPTCYETAAAPFGECPAGAYAFPDGRTCCPLDGPSGGQSGGSTACASTPADDPSGATDAGAAAAPACNLPCPPGAYSNTTIGFEATTPACTPADVSLPGAECLFCCFDNGTPGGASCMSNTCDCPGNYPCQCIPSCPTCPAGWQPPAAGQFDLCCQTSAGGTTRCFSQSSVVETPG